MQKDTAILAAWEKFTNFKLDKKLCKIYILKDVNNYSVMQSKNEIKRKGVFSHAMLGKGLNADIVGIAVENYIYKGIPVEETIKNCKDIRLFLYSRGVGREFQAEINSEKIQRINRYFVSKAARASKLQKRKIQGKTENITAKYKVVLANDLNDKGLINLVDRQHYETKANEHLNRLLAKQRARELVKSNLLAVETLQKQGLTLIPKTYKDNPKGLSLKNLPEKFDFSTYPTVAIATGVDVIAIDVDYPDRLPNQLKELLKNSNSLKSFVDPGGKFKIFFKIRSKGLNQGNYLKKYGFEILCDKPANVAGAYDYKNNYQFMGTIVEIPDEIFKILHRIQNIEKKSVDKKQTYATLCKNEVDATLDYIREFLTVRGIEFSEKEARTTFEKEVCDENCQVVFRFPCPFSDEHTNSGGNEVLLCLDENNRIFMRCWHESCSDSVFALQKEANAGLYERLLGLKQQTGIKINKPLEEITLEDLLNEY